MALTVDNVFQRLDVNGDGVVTMEEFTEVCQTVNITTRQEAYMGTDQILRGVGLNQGVFLGATRGPNTKKWA